MKTIIGVTGRVCVGKTYLVNELVKRNPHYAVIDLDKLGHLVLKKNPIKESIKKIFGDNIIGENKEIDMV